MGFGWKFYGQLSASCFAVCACLPAAPLSAQARDSNRSLRIGCRTRKRTRRVTYHHTRTLGATQRGAVWLPLCCACGGQ